MILNIGFKMTDTLFVLFDLRWWYVWYDVINLQKKKKETKFTFSIECETSGCDGIWNMEFVTIFVLTFSNDALKCILCQHNFGAHRWYIFLPTVNN